jgi:hypothetical protein
MGLLDSIRKWQERKSVKKEKYKEAEEEMKINKLLEERSKSNNKRELERFYREEEEEEIKKALEHIRMKKQRELWSGKNAMINQKTTILDKGNPILKQKNIFKEAPNLFTKQHIKEAHCDMGFFK